MNPASIFRACCKTAACATLLIFIGCIPRPLDLQLNNSQDNKPIEGLTIHRHSVTLLTLLATGSNAVKSDAAGEARVWVPPFNTKLTLLQPGFEPASIGVFSSNATDTMLIAENSSRMVLRFSDLENKERRTMLITPVKYVAVRVKVIDSITGAPIHDAEILATTFLYLPMPGLEDRWGFPELQTLRTDSAGQSTVNYASGFRNIMTARKPGFQEARQDFLESNSVDEVVLKLRPLETKMIRFKTVEDEDGKPVANVLVKLDEKRNGLPPDPNGFVAATDASGQSPPVPVPNLMPLVVETECSGYRHFSLGLDWRSLRDGQIVTLKIHKKGWFE